MTMLTMIQDAQKRMGLNVSSTVAGNTDQTAVQLLALLNLAGKELSDVYTWQALIDEATWTTTATESQGDMDTLAPGFKFIVNQTIWDRSLRRPVFGALSAQEWQLLKASAVTGPYSQYRIRNNELLFIPVPAAGDTCAFEYVTRYWATDTTGNTGKDAFTVDSDLSKLEEDLLVLSLVWRFKQAQGLDYSLELQMYENSLQDVIARDGGKPELNMEGRMTAMMPGMMVPQGNWPL